MACSADAGHQIEGLSPTSLADNAGGIERYYSKGTLSGCPLTVRVERLPFLPGIAPPIPAFPMAGLFAPNRVDDKKAQGIPGMEGKTGWPGLGNHMSAHLQA